MPFDHWLCKFLYNTTQTPISTCYNLIVDTRNTLFLSCCYKLSVVWSDSLFHYTCSYLNDVTSSTCTVREGSYMYQYVQEKVPHSFLHLLQWLHCIWCCNMLGWHTCLVPVTYKTNYQESVEGSFQIATRQFVLCVTYYMEQSFCHCISTTGPAEAIFVVQAI